MDRDTFKFTMIVLAEATNKKLADDQGNPSPLFKLWWDKYGALPDGILLAAFGQALDRCRFFPSPAEFNEILDGVKRAAGVGDPRPEDETATLLKKISRYNPDLGIVNDGTRGLIVAGQHNRGEDNPQSGFTARERHILRLFGGAARCAAWDDKDVQFNRPRMVEAFKQAAEDTRVERQYQEIAEGGGWLGQGLRPLPRPERPRLVSGDE
jgi:hypothetical protein